LNQAQQAANESANHHYEFSFAGEPIVGRNALENESD
jgi:hypothetical protein